MIEMELEESTKKLHKYWVEFEDYSKLSGLTAQQVAYVKQQEKNGGMKVADWGVVK